MSTEVAKDQLFLIEILIETINFSLAWGTVPIKKNLVINCHFGTLTALEIRPDGVGVVEQGSERSEKKRRIEFNCGKSYLFPCKPDELISAIINCPLQLTISTKSNPPMSGQTIVKWNNDFVEMVSYSKESAGYITPVFQKKNFPIVNANEEQIGDIDIFVRLSCFGDSVQTNIQVVANKDAKDGAPGGGGKQFLFKSTTYATTFQCQKYGLGTSQEVLPVAPIYNVASGDDINSRRMETIYSGSYSDADAAEKGSIMGSVFDLDFITGIPKLTSSQLSYISTMTGFADITSLRRKPEENKFFNIPAAVNAEIDPLIPISELHRQRGASTYSSDLSFNENKLTKENIEKCLCNNPHCPAVKKFKEFGIGPLATGKGLGTVYPGPYNPPVTYGMSHCTGTIDNYGPYGVYQRPRNLDEPYKPKDGGEPKPTDSTCASSCNCLYSKRQDNQGDHSKNEEPRLSGGCDEPLRLTGGSPGAKDEFPQPMAACRDLMEGFDKVLEAYKRAIGPCGNVTCPFAQTVMEDQCQKLCTGTMDPHHDEDAKTCVEEAIDLVCTGPPTNDDTLSACGMISCPYNRANIGTPTEKEFIKTQMKPACGDAHCPYTLQKLGMDVDDFVLDVKDLPKTCGFPKCPFNPLPDLPPIHWECPEPLPKGLCKNPQCPYLPKELQCLARAKSPCGGPSCPYKQPPPCGTAGCPFEPPKECPYAKKQKKPCPHESPSNPCPFSDMDSQPNPLLPCPMGPCCPLMNPCVPCPLAPTTCPYSPCPPPVICPAAALGPLLCPVSPCPLAPPMCGAGGDVTQPVYSVVADGCQDPGKCGFLQTKPQVCDQSVCPGLVGEPGVPHKSSDIGKPKKAEKPPGSTTNTAPPSEEECCEENISCTSATCIVQGKGGNLTCGTCEIVEKTAGSSSKPSSKTSPDSPDSKKSKKKDSSKKSAPEKQAETKPGAKKKHPKKTSNYVYGIGDQYPGVKIGHRECVLPGYPIPANMGWMWNIFTPCLSLKPRRGWRPGAIGRTIADRIRAHREAHGLEMLNPLNPKPSKSKKRAKSKGKYSAYTTSSDETVAPKPTLQIKKKDGAYWITMNPLKDPLTLEDNENPYMDCTPMQFKITKNKDKVMLRNEEDGEFATCYCGDGEPASTDSELDIEFTPPAGIIHPEKLKKKKNVVHIDTQYDEKDLPKKGKKGKGKKGKDKKGKKGKKGKGKKKKK